MSTVCFVNPDSLNVTPYFSQYLDCCEDGYEVVYWHRGSAKPDASFGEHVYFSPVDSPNPLLKLVQLAKGYLGFRAFASKVLRRGDFDKVVALTGNTGALLGGVLRKRYSGRYLVDVRDYFLEGVPLYARLEKKALDGAAFVVASSPAYTAFLGERPLEIMHNDQKIVGVSAIDKRESGPGPFVLVSIGTAKNLGYDRRVIDFFANDDRFLLRFAGRGYEPLGQYVAERGIANVRVEGEFSSDRTLEMYQGTDAVLNMYGNHHPHFDYALPNKLYFAARLGLPIVVCPDTYLAEVVSENSLGLSLDLGDPESKERVLRLWDESERRRRQEGASRFICEVERQNEETKGKIAAFLRS